ncbi:hypothetical protein T4D_12813 [Trichinella pseudospiralis]|uniref:Uncharacterized protein n=1 Tax=Trichinella pseudospiralis TaxID=6337 RepID=A0A0V1FRW3_TRIPS|nr:hypothetical protein T4D_12813 [Trichinella pseudospiralis]
MPSLKREAERKGKAAANTGSSPNSEGRANSLAEETDEPARGSGSSDPDQPLQPAVLAGVDDLLDDALSFRSDKKHRDHILFRTR